MLATSGGKPEIVSAKELGISFPVLRNPGPIETTTLTNTSSADAHEKLAGSETPKKTVEVRKFDFTVQFAWQPKPPSVRQVTRQNSKVQNVQNSPAAAR